jgi:hypothetical protein
MLRITRQLSVMTARGSPPAAVMTRRRTSRRRVDRDAAAPGRRRDAVQLLDAERVARRARGRKCPVDSSLHGLPAPLARALRLRGSGAAQFETARAHVRLESVSNSPVLGLGLASIAANVRHVTRARVAFLLPAHVSAGEMR